MNEAPLFLQDTASRLTDKGFTHDDVWYHGTSSALWTSIQKDGLKRSGDKELKQAAKKTMATIGNHYVETTEPIFLCPSKELAYYWAQQKVRERSLRFAGEERPIVIELTLSEELLAKVKPDVGAASLLLLEEGERYLAFIAKLAQGQGFSVPNIDLKNADRMAYLKQIGLAYIDTDIAASYLKLLEE
tara:strand:- start:20891 stop:21454 length:564 start_codon:yes stop_codon:yes gene_type:complete